MKTEITLAPGLALPPVAQKKEGDRPTLELALERRWIEAAQNGDQEAFTRLVEAHQESIFSLCLRLLACREDAAEACQDVFVRAFRALPSYRPEARFSTWLYQIAVNRCHDFWKRASSRLKGMTSTLTGRELSVAATASPPDHRAGWAEALKQLDEALQALPARDREILILSCVENLSHAECALILRTSERGIEGRLYRARAKLRRLWPKDPKKK